MQRCRDATGPSIVRLVLSDESKIPAHTRPELTYINNKKPDISAAPSNMQLPLRAVKGSSTTSQVKLSIFAPRIIESRCLHLRSVNTFYDPLTSSIGGSTCSTTFLWAVTPNLNEREQGLTARRYGCLARLSMPRGIEFRKSGAA
jgi:hypothetical protein